MKEKNSSISYHEYLFGTPDRKYTFVSVILSIISVFITVYLWKYPENVPKLIIFRDTFVISGLIIMLILIAFKFGKREVYLISENENLVYSNNELKRKLDLRINKQYSNFHSSVHKFRDDMFKFYSSDLPDQCILQEKDKIAFLRICHSTTDSVKKSMIEYLKSKDIYLNDYDDICVTVKLMLESNNIIELYGNTIDRDTKSSINKKKKWIITVYRDPDTYEKARENREVGTRLYSVEDNSAYMHICISKKAYFCSDNLIEMGDKYINENPSWRENYNATIVVPIRYYNKDSGFYRVFGFISIDSLNKDKNELFCNNTSRYIVGHSADLMASFFLAIWIANAKKATA